MKRAADALAALSSPLLFLLFFAAVALGHLTLLRLPYYWDEGGYYVPAALDFYHTGTLVPAYTNAHPPLPNVLLGTLWHLTGYHILATRLLVCAVAAAALVAVFRLTQRLLTPSVAVATTLLTAVYPIWFAQSTLAHADIFAAAFTLVALAVYLPRLREQQNIGNTPAERSSTAYIWAAVLLALSVLSKETAIIQPAALAAFELWLLIRDRCSPGLRRTHLCWLTAFCFPLLPLIAWYAYHHHRTGFTFGNPEYLRYNATANFTLAHIASAFYKRFLHLFWQRNMWVPIVFAVACLLFLRPLQDRARGLTRPVLHAITVLIASNWLMFSVLGGAPLTRYLLPMYPLLLLVCVAAWRSRTQWWPALAAVTAALFVAGWWLSPPTSFAPEDCLAYRDMIVVQQQAIWYIDGHFPDATVLTAWPASAELQRPELGYSARPIRVQPLENFTAPQVDIAAQEPEKFDTALVITTHFVSPSLRRYLMANPLSRRGREFAQERDLTPQEIAAKLDGEIVFSTERNGEWAAVVRFPRTYVAQAHLGALFKQAAFDR